MSDNIQDELFIENAKIIYPNFAGKATAFKPEGTREFSIQLTREVAEELQTKNWNVKVRPSKEAPEDPDESLYHLPVTVRFGGRPPTIWMVTSKGRTCLPEDLVQILDWMVEETTNIDLKIRPYDWKMKSSGLAGRKAYLKIAYFTLYEDPIHKKYEGVPDLNLADLQVGMPKEIAADDGVVDAEIVSETVEYVKDLPELTRGNS